MLLRVLLPCLTLLGHFRRSDAQAADLTLEMGASGKSVVLATISRLDQLNIFADIDDDNRLLRRVAFVESRDGLDADTFRQGYNGGIWQVDEAVFVKTQDTTTHPILASPGGIFERLLSTVGLDWNIASWADLRRPLLSAVAARIFFEIAAEDIPDIGDVLGQGEFWKSSGFNTNNNDTIELFVQRTNVLESEECPNRGIDLAFVLDSSGSVGMTNFELERNLVLEVVRLFDIGPNGTQIAVITYSGFAVVNFRLSDHTNQTSVLRAISEVEFFDLPGDSGPRRRTNTADALTRLRTEVFTESGGARSSDVAIPRIAVVITDGGSNVNASQTIPSALALRDTGATVYSIAIGDEIDQNEVMAIASAPENVRQLSSFNVMEFQGLRSRITNEACMASAPVALEQTISIELDQGETSFFEYQVPTEGITLRLMREAGSATLLASNKVRNPNTALYDYRIDGQGEVFVDLSEPLDNDRKRRQAEGVDGPFNLNLFVSVEGVGSGKNSFQIMAQSGNTVLFRRPLVVGNGCNEVDSLSYMVLLFITLTITLLHS